MSRTVNEKNETQMLRHPQQLAFSWPGLLVFVVYSDHLFAGETAPSSFEGLQQTIFYGILKKTLTALKVPDLESGWTAGQGILSQVWFSPWASSCQVT